MCTSVCASTYMSVCVALCLRLFDCIINGVFFCKNILSQNPYDPYHYGFNDPRTQLQTQSYQPIFPPTNPLIQIVHSIFFCALFLTLFLFQLFTLFLYTILFLLFFPFILVIFLPLLLMQHRQLHLPLFLGSSSHSFLFLSPHSTSNSHSTSHFSCQCLFHSHFHFKPYLSSLLLVFITSFHFPLFFPPIAYSSIAPPLPPYTSHPSIIFLPLSYCYVSKFSTRIITRNFLINKYVCRHFVLDCRRLCNRCWCVRKWCLGFCSCICIIVVLIGCVHERRTFWSINYVYKW